MRAARYFCRHALLWFPPSVVALVYVEFNMSPFALSHFQLISDLLAAVDGDSFGNGH